MAKLPSKFVVPKPKKRGRPAPATKVIPNKKKEAAKRACRKKVVLRRRED